MAMELIIILILLFVFSIASFIAKKFYLKFSAYPLYLSGIYLFCLLAGIVSLKINYWHLHRLNSLTLPFTASSGNKLKFNFIPQYNGEYSVDITFQNEEKNKTYELCDVIYPIVYKTNRSSQEDCKNELIYRTITADINNDHFSKRLQYNDVASDIAWGDYNYSLKKSALHIYEFQGIKNTTVPMIIKIDTSQEEIQQAGPKVVIGPLDEVWKKDIILTYSGKISIFIAFVLPFVFSIILLVFNYVFNRK